jgi:hypothetical protein
VGIDSSVGLLVATLDLQLVRLVRAAMQAGGGAGGGGAGRTIHPAPVIEPRRRIEPEPAIEPRLRVRPELEIEPRMRPGIGESTWCRPQAACPVAPAEPVEKGAHSTSPIEPPWKVRPWEQQDSDRVRPVRKIKVIQARPDIQSTGTVIDLFI